MVSASLPCATPNPVNCACAFDLHGQRAITTYGILYDGPVNSEITLTMKSGKTICAVITHDSFARLGLNVGESACAVFKASAVILCKYA